MRGTCGEFAIRVRCFASPRNDGEKNPHDYDSTTTDTPKPRIDCTRPVLWLFAAVMIVLIVLPLSWLMVYAFTDKARHPTLQNFVTLFTNPDFLDPLLTTAIIATTSAVICCLVAAPIGWLVSRTDMPGRQTIRALVTASFVTPPFLGAVAWELLAAPNSGMLNQLYRYLTGAEDPLFNIYSLTGLIFVISCYTFPFVFVLVANALDNMPGELEDASAILGGKAWTTARRVTIPLGAARAGRRRVDRVPAGHDAVRFARDPGAAGRLPHHDDEDLEPVPVSAETRARGCGRRAAAAADDPAAAGPEIPARPPRLLGGRRQIRRAAPDRDEGMALGGAGVLSAGAAQSGVPAVLRAAQRGVLAERDHAGDAVDGDAAQYRVRVHRAVVDQTGAEEHGDPGRGDGDHRHHARAGRSPMSRRGA